jgi:hypothetical protein
MRLAGHVARIWEARNVYRILVGKPEGKRLQYSDLVGKVFIASSEKSILEGARGALKIVHKLAYLLTDCALCSGGQFKFSSGR